MRLPRNSVCIDGPGSNCIKLRHIFHREAGKEGERVGGPRAAVSLWGCRIQALSWAPPPKSARVLGPPASTPGLGALGQHRPQCVLGPVSWESSALPGERCFLLPPRAQNNLRMHFVRVYAHTHTHTYTQMCVHGTHTHKHMMLAHTNMHT